MYSAGYAVIAVLYDWLEQADVSDIPGSYGCFIMFDEGSIGVVQDVFLYGLIQGLILNEREVTRNVFNDAGSPDGSSTVSGCISYLPV